MKTVLVTGATDGIGKMTALRLAKKGYHVIVHGRSVDRVAKVVGEVTAAAGAAGKVDSVVFDLSSLADVRKGAQQILARFPRIDVLLNNAGTYQQERHSSVDGFESTMAINHLGPTLLTFLLKPTLVNSGSPRVIFVSSIAHQRGDLDPEDYNFEKRFSPYEAYAASKLANVITTRQLAKEWASDEVGVYALHPGVITTKLLKAGFNMDGDTVQRGSDTSVHLATADLFKDDNGQYFVDSRVAPVSVRAKDAHKVQFFWDWTLASIQKFR